MRAAVQVLLLTACCTIAFFSTNGCASSPAPAPQPAYVTGHVRDEATGAPIEGCSVAIPRQRLETLTDRSGGYRLTLRGTGEHEIEFRHPQYAPRNAQIDARSGANTLDVALPRAAR